MWTSVTPVSCLKLPILLGMHCPERESNLRHPVRTCALQKCLFLVWNSHYCCGHVIIESLHNTSPRGPPFLWNRSPWPPPFLLHTRPQHPKRDQTCNIQQGHMHFSNACFLPETLGTVGLALPWKRVKPATSCEDMCTSVMPVSCLKLPLLLGTHYCRESFTTRVPGVCPFHETEVPGPHPFSIHTSPRRPPCPLHTSP
jgi:hypothetical protein